MQNIRLSDLLLIDVETVPQSPGFEDLDEHWKILWEEKVQRNLSENTTAQAFYGLRAGVMAEFARVICISIGCFTNGNNEPGMRLKSFYGDDEKLLLENFIFALNEMEKGNHRRSFAGHNIKEFDIPFICRRLLVNGMGIPPYLDFQNMKPWETNIIDTFQYWRFGDYKQFTSLKLLSAVLGVASSKDDIDGSMVAGLYWTKDPAAKEENMRRIVAYCEKDVVSTGNIILRFRNIPPVTPDRVSISSG